MAPTHSAAERLDTKRTTMRAVAGSHTDRSTGPNFEHSTEMSSAQRETTSTSSSPASKAFSTTTQRGRTGLAAAAAMASEASSAFSGSSARMLAVVASSMRKSAHTCVPSFLRVPCRAATAASAASLSANRTTASPVRWQTRTSAAKPKRAPRLEKTCCRACRRAAEGPPFSYGLPFLVGASTNPHTYTTRVTSGAATGLTTAAASSGCGRLPGRARFNFETVAS
mmetsp:Transcript_10913/g.36433  ORF Transcript_10913/g.36433 Transcript_10913/m.36433 type:complete len:225 (+) Transcript_10913:494-1168(+)